MLRGGHRNSLGRTAEVVEATLADRARLEELFAALDDEDALVRMRVGDALEKVCREQPDWFVGHVDRIIDEMGAIAQPSVQWHTAQILDRVDLTEDQSRRALALLQANLATSTDWIVLNLTMDVLTGWADPAWLRPELERLAGDARTSVARRAAKRLAELQ